MRLNERIRRMKFGRQLRLVYMAAVILPVTVFGLFLLRTVNNSQMSYHTDMLRAYSKGVTQTLYEIMSQIYTISDSLVYNDDLMDFLKGDYRSDTEMRVAAADAVLPDRYEEKYAGVDEILIYYDRPDMVDTGQFRRVDDEIRSSDWYRKAMDQYLPFWMAYESESGRGRNMVWNLTLVRKMVLVGGDKEAVIMIKVRNSYLGSRLEDSKYTTMLEIGDQPIAYSNSLAYFGTMPQTEVDYTDTRYSFSGEAMLDGKRALTDISTKKISKTSDYMYLFCYDQQAIDNTEGIMTTCWIMLVLAVIVPLVVIMVFSERFAGQVKRLRREMNKASRGEYSEMKQSLKGSLELTEAFDDLKLMVQNIQAMEAEQYEAQIRNQDIINEQQKMEFKMLSSQINPHFLYNTLETIRMKALTADDREVANAIKILGKLMRYVLDNSGMSDTTLQKEYDHILNYLQIQRLRFGDRVNYETEIQPDMNLDEIRILPLLLQPLVENAIIHGLEGRESNGQLKISFKSASGTVFIDVEDNGNGMSEEELSNITAHLSEYREELPTENIGLYNINRRIKLNYGPSYGIAIDSAPRRGTKVSIVIPLQKV